MPEIRSGRSGPDLNPRKKSPVKLMVGIAAVALIAVGVGYGLTHLPGGSPGAGGPGGGRPGGPGGPPGAGGRGGARGGGGGGFGGGFGGFGGRGGFANTTVGIATANLGAIPIQLDALGTVTPPITANITTRVAGQLMAVYFTEGQTVKKGQKLALIDPRPYQVALEQAQAQMARDQASLNQARVDLKRYQTLLAQNSIAAQQVDTQDALVKQDEATVKGDQANVDNAKLNLSYTQITAPAAGRVGLRQVDVGNYINAASQTLLVLTQVDPIDVVYTIPEDNVPQITARQRSGASLPATVFDRSGGNILANGKLSTLDNTIDTTTGTVKAKARFDNGSGALYPNQFVNVRMLVDVLCNAIVVPATAVRHGSQGDYVFTVDPKDRIAHQTPVTTGPGTGETVSITSGLKGGETVITDGGDRLRDGSTVNLPGQAQQGGSGFQRRPGAQGGQGGRNGQGGQFRGGQGFQGGQGFPGGQGGQGFRGQGAGGQGGQAFGGANGQNFRGRFGRGGQGGQGGQGANIAAPDKDTQARATGEAIPLADAAAACSAKGRGGHALAGRNGAGGGGNPRFASGQGFPPGGFRRGQFGQGGQGQGGQGQGGQGFNGGQGFPPGGFRGGQFGQGGQGQGGQGQGGQGFPQGGPRGQNGQLQGGQFPGGQGFPPGGFRRRGQGQGQGSGQGGDQSQAQGQGG